MDIRKYKKIEWPYNLMTAINGMVPNPEMELATCKEDAPEDLELSALYLFDRFEHSGYLYNFFVHKKTTAEIATMFNTSPQSVSYAIKRFIYRIGKATKAGRLILKYGIHHIVTESWSTYQNARHHGYIVGYEAGYEQGYRKAQHDIKPRRVEIEEVGFSSKAYICLKRGGYNYLDEVEKVSDEELLKCHALGRKSLEDIRNTIAKFKEVNHG